MTFYSPVYLLICHRLIQWFVIYYHHVFTVTIYKIVQDEPRQMSSSFLFPKPNIILFEFISTTLRLSANM